uniref:PIF-5.4 n=1 Tax=Venturia canescens TaxID=32260 RepID=A0A0U1ZIU5_9HYME|nr:PIF-5.4 [Venturia canescens]
MAAPTDIEFRKAQQKVTDFVTKLKILGGPIKSTSVANIQKWLKHVNIGIPPLDKALRSLRVEKTQGYLTFNGAPSGALYKMFRAADLTGIIKLSKLKIAIRASDKSMFDELTATYPEKLMQEMRQAVTEARRKHPGLNPKTVALRNIPGEWKGSLENFEDTGTSVGNLSPFNDSKKGCWMYTTKGVKAWCKVNDYSFLESAANEFKKEFCNTPMNHYHVTLVIMAIVNNDDNNNPLKKRLADAVNIDVRYLSSKLEDMLRNKFEVLKDFVKKLHETNQVPEFEVCGLPNLALRGSTMPKKCRMCDSTACPESTQSFAESQWSGDIASTCITSDAAWNALQGGSAASPSPEKKPETKKSDTADTKRAVVSGISAISASAFCGRVGKVTGAGCGSAAIFKVSRGNNKNKESGGSGQSSGGSCKKENSGSKQEGRSCNRENGSCKKAGSASKQEGASCNRENGSCKKAGSASKQDGASCNTENGFCKKRNGSGSGKNDKGGGGSSGKNDGGSGSSGNTKKGGDTKRGGDDGVKSGSGGK